MCERCVPRQADGRAVAAVVRKSDPGTGPCGVPYLLRWVTHFRCPFTTSGHVATVSGTLFNAGQSSVEQKV